MNQPKFKTVDWIGSSLKDLKKMPDEVQKTFGTQLLWVQHGVTPDTAKPLTGNDINGVYELREDFNGDTYRAAYIAKLGDTVYVLHCFKKKSKKGISTPQEDIDLIKSRLKLAKDFEAEKKKKFKK